MEELFDIAIIGTGPGGLEAAITGKVRNKKILLIGSKDLSKKMNSEAIYNYLGLGVVSGSKMKEAFLNHLKELDLEITEDNISKIYNLGDTFALQGKTTLYNTKTVILATGVVPPVYIKGEEALVGQGVSYCATCDAPLYRKKEISAILYNKKDLDEVLFLASVCSKVNLFTLENELEIEDSLKDKINIVNEKVIEIKKVDQDIVVNQISSKAVFIFRDAIVPSKLIDGLKMDGNHIEVNRKMETSIPGLFACGDLVGLPYQYIKAAGEGNIASLSAVSYLEKRK